MASAEDQFRTKLRKIEALFAGAATPGEKAAAGAAAERIRRQLEAASSKEAAEEYKFSIGDPWSRKLFIALCRRYGVRPYRYPRMQRQTVVVRAPPSFVRSMLWPEFEQLSQALTAHLNQITESIIREEVHGETRDADEVAEPRRLR